MSWFYTAQSNESKDSKNNSRTTSLFKYDYKNTNNKIKVNDVIWNIQTVAIIKYVLSNEKAIIVMSNELRLLKFKEKLGLLLYLIFTTFEQYSLKEQW